MQTRRVDEHGERKAIELGALGRRQLRQRRLGRLPLRALREAAPRERRRLRDLRRREVRGVLGHRRLLALLLRRQHAPRRLAVAVAVAVAGGGTRRRQRERQPVAQPQHVGRRALESNLVGLGVGLAAAEPRVGGVPRGVGRERGEARCERRRHHLGEARLVASEGLERRLRLGGEALALVGGVCRRRAAQRAEARRDVGRELLRELRRVLLVLVQRLPRVGAVAGAVVGGVPRGVPRAPLERLGDRRRRDRRAAPDAREAARRPQPLHLRRRLLEARPLLHAVLAEPSARGVRRGLGTERGEALGELRRHLLRHRRLVLLKLLPRLLGVARQLEPLVGAARDDPLVGHAPRAMPAHPAAVLDQLVRKLTSQARAGLEAELQRARRRVGQALALVDGVPARVPRHPRDGLGAGARRRAAALQCAGTAAAGTQPVALRDLVEWRAEALRVVGALAAGTIAEQHPVALDPGGDGADLAGLV